MPEKHPLRNLYMDKSVDGLKKTAESVIHDNKYSNQNCIKLLPKMFEAADKSLSEGDEERAFTLFYRTAGLYLRCKKNKETDHKYLDLMLPGPKFKKCIEYTESLSKSLEKRYQMLQEAEKNHMRVTNGPSADHPTLPDKKSSPQKLEADSSSVESAAGKPVLITCKQLYDYMESDELIKCREKPVLMLLDTRSSDDFNKSHMDRFKVELSDAVSLLNIPLEILKSATTLKSLEKSLPPASVATLKKRKSAKKIVVVDWESLNVDDVSGSVRKLYDILTKWDSSSDKCRVPPLVLKGGFKEWNLTYPTHSSDPHFVPSKTISITSPSVNHVSYDFEENKKVNSPPKINGFQQKTDVIPVKTPSVHHVKVPSTVDLKSDKKGMWSKATPGGAKPVQPMPDRTTKPKVNSPEVTSTTLRSSSSTPPKELPKQSADALREKKLLQLDNEMNVMKIEELTALLALKDAEDQKRREASKPVPLNPSRVSASDGDTLQKPPVTQSSLINKNNNDTSLVETRTRNTDRTISESKPEGVGRRFSSSTGGGLSRSYSSPNIAQLGQDEEEEENDNRIGNLDRRQSINPPRFDRTLKPSSTSAHFKHRNFAPVYGLTIAGNTGLKNLGNTCFMNAVIQCLSSTFELGSYFNEMKHMQDMNRNSRFGTRGELTEELAELIKQMWSGQFKNLTPRDLKDAVSKHMPVFVGCEQQDAHEFLTMLLEKLHNDLNRCVENGPITIPSNLSTPLAVKKFWTAHTSKNSSIISQLFEGLLLSTLECSVCHTKSDSFEVFTCLSLPIPNGNRIQLMDCFKLFCEPELMTGDAAWDCPTCKCKRDSVKRIQLTYLPKVMIIHLKRFSYEGMWRQKLQTTVEFPLNSLDVKNFAYVNQSTPPSYNLYGIINHYGTLEGGHYISFSKNPTKSKWFKFDDHEVSDLSPADVKTQAAYVLFYTASS